MKTVRKMALLTPMILILALSSGCVALQELEQENEQLRRSNTELQSQVDRLQMRIAELQGTIRSAQEIADQRASEIEKLRAKIGATPGLDILDTPEGIVIRMSNQILFALGSTDLDQEARSTLQSVGRALQTDFAGHSFRVVGHADKVPLRPGAKYPSNWELSSARACAVVRFLVDGNFVQPERIVAAGHSYYDPAVPWAGKTNVPENRRVEILVLPRRTDSSFSPGTPQQRRDLPITPK